MDKNELLNQLENNNGFYKHNNYKLVDYKDEEYVELKAELNDNSMNPYGFAHGGLILLWEFLQGALEKRQLH